MATDLGSLVVGLKADLRKYELALKEAERKTSRSSRAMDRAMDRVRTKALGVAKATLTWRNAIIAVGAATALGALVKRTADETAALAEQADKLGIGIEALQEYRFAAKLAGIETRTTDLAIQRFTRRAAEAAQGTGEARDALRELGVGLTDANGNLRSADELLLDVADGLAGVETQGDRVRLAFKLFDSEGVAFVNVLQEGREALLRTRAEAREMGVVLEEDLVRKGQKASRQLEILQQRAGTPLKTALIELAPAIVKIADALGDVAIKGGVAVNRLKDLQNLSVEELKRELASVENELSALLNRQQFLPEYLQGLLQGDIDNRVERMLEVRRRLAQIDAGEGKRPPVLVGGGRRPPPGIESPLGGTTPIGDPFQAQRTEQAKARKEFLADARQDYLQATNQRVALIELERDAKLRQLEELGLAEQDAASAREQINLSAQARIEEVNAESFRSMEQLAQRAFQGIAGAIADMALGAEVSFDTIKQSFARMLIEMALQAAASGLFNAVSAGAAGPFGAITGFLSGLIPRQHGGPVSAGRGYLVGERGPEMFVPRSAGAIAPNVALSPRITVQVVNQGAPLRTTGQELRGGPGGQQVLRVMVEQIAAESMARGGPLARATEQRFHTQRRGTV